MNTQESDIRQLLDEVDLATPKIDFGEVVRLGERARRRRRLIERAAGAAVVAGVVAAVAVPLALRVPAAHPPAAVTVPRQSPAPSPSPSTAAVGTCSAAALALPPGMNNYQAQAVDTTGRYVVGWASSDVIYATMFWDNGRPQAMRVPGKPGVDGVNAHGVAAGSTLSHGFRDENVYRWSNGATTILNYPMRGRWHPYSIYIDDNGDIIANAEPSGQSGGTGAVTLLWKPGSTTAVRLPLPSGSEVFGITNSGLIIGNLNLSDNDPTNNRGAVWDLQGKLLRTLPFVSYLDALSPTGDLAVGRAGSAPSDPDYAFTWDLRTGTVTRLDRRVTMAAAINARGWVLDSHGLLFKGDQTFTLPPLRAGNVAWGGGLADDGTVVGDSYASKPGSVTTPMRWRC